MENTQTQLRNASRHKAEHAMYNERDSGKISAIELDLRLRRYLNADRVRSTYVARVLETMALNEQ